MRVTVAFLLLCATVLADGPSIVGTPALRVKVGSPPWVMLAVKDAPPNAVQLWSGAIGPGKVAVEVKDGLAVSNSVAGVYPFRCILQVPKDGLDDVQILDVTVLVEGSDGVIPPPPPPPPVEDFASKLTAAVKALPAAHAGLEKVANVYGLVADQIKSGLLTGPEPVTRMTSLLTGLASPDWAALDTAIVQPHLKTLTLTTAGDYEPVWRQVQSAIKAGLTDIPPPPPDVDPPIPVTSLHVLVVEEKDGRRELPASQVAIFTSTELRKWLTDNGAQWRMFVGGVDTSHLEQKWKDGLKKVADSGLELPVVLVSNGAKGTIERLPKSVAELTTLLERFK
jgi:hypothetical protein